MQELRALLIVLAGTVLAIAPYWLGAYYVYILNLMLINVIVAIGLNILIGNSGQTSLCHSSFMGMGAYLTVILCTRYQMTYWIAAPVAITLTGLVGALLGYPARRLAGIYLALATFGFLQIVQIGIEEFSEITGGVRGIEMAKPSIFGWPLKNDHRLYMLVFPVTVLMVWVAFNIERTRVGRAFNAMRQSAYATQALGISVPRTKVVAFAISAVYAAVGGALLAPVVGFIEPNEFGVLASVQQVAFIVVGGLGSISGSVLGALVLTALPEALREVKDYLDIVYASILLLFLLLMPRGLIVLWDLVHDWLNRPAVKKVSIEPAVD
jgi:branched-chain amino acid transport system permease protein